MEQTQDLISGRTAAKRLGVSPATITNWVRDGKLIPVARLDGSVLIFDASYIARIAAERQPKQTAAAA